MIDILAVMGAQLAADACQRDVEQIAKLIQNKEEDDPEETYCGVSRRPVAETDANEREKAEEVRGGRS